MTDKEKLSCLLDRPCGVCKFYNKDGCCKWTCVFDQKSELPEGEYIKKTDVLDKAVIETLSDYTEHDVVHVDEINKLPTYSAPKREKDYEECNTMEWIPARVGKLFPSNDYKCSKCGNILNFDGVNCGRGDANFCPNCGRKAVSEWQ